MQTDAGAVDGLAPALDTFIARFVPLERDGNQAAGLCPFCDSGGRLTVFGASWRTSCCCAQELHQGDHIGFYACWTDTTREQAIAALGNGAGLPEAKPIVQVPLKRLPFWGGWALDKPQLRDKAVWVHDLSGSVLIWRELAPQRAHLGLIHGQSWDKPGMLGQLAKRKVVLVPENNPASRAKMQLLAAALYRAGHEKVMRLDLGIDPEFGTRELPRPGDDVLKWAKVRSEAYPHPDMVNAAPQDNKADSRPPNRDFQAPSSGSSPNTSGPAGAAPYAAPEPEPDGPAAPASSTPERAQEAAQDALGAITATADTRATTPPARAKPALALVDGSALRRPQPENEPEPLPAFSEFALASAFADGPGRDWRYTAAWLEWAKWNGVRWVPDEVRRITWELRDCCTVVMNSHMSDSTPLQRMRLTTLKTVNAVMTLAGSDPGIAVSASQWDADPMLLGTPGGIVDLSTGQLVTADRSQMISRSTGVSPTPGEHPWWDRVLARSGADMGEFLQLWCGYMLTGDTREERFLFIHGPGGGGKSKFMLVLSEILGDYRRTTKMESFTAQQRQEHSEEIARLAGARLVIATETDEGSRWNEARIKALTGRDAIAARHMHKSTFEFKPQFKLVFVGNHRPALRSVGEEMRRRIDLIEWGATIPEEERILDLPDKLRAEYPAILAWMIEGCLLWQKQGLGKPQSIVANVSEYIQGEDTLGGWLEERAILKPSARTLGGAAYRSFKGWADAAGEFVPSQKRFTQRLRERGFETIKSGERYFVGFELKADEQYGQGDYVPESARWTPD